MTNSTPSDGVNDALKAIQKERGDEHVGSVVKLHAQVDNQSIINTLPGNEDESVSNDNNDSQSTDKETSNKNQKIVIEPQPLKKSKLKLIVMVLLFSAVGVLITLTYVNYTSKSSTVSLPQFSNWSLFNNTEKVDPVITSSALEQAILNIKIDVANSLESLPLLDKVSKLEQQINTLQRAYNQQKQSLNSINSALDNMTLSQDALAQTEQFNILKQEIDTLNTYTGDILSKFDKIDKNSANLKTLTKQTKELTNSNWSSHLRIKKLENGALTSTKQPSDNNVQVTKMQPLKAAEQVTWRNKNPWRLKIASERFTQIINTSNNKPLRVYKGVVIDSCGVVLDIDVAGRKVTTPHCVITRNTGK